MWWLGYWTAAVVLVGLAAGYAFGKRQGLRDAAEEADRMLRIDPPNRTEGLPTNLDGEPAVIKKPRIARSHWMR